MYGETRNWCGRYSELLLLWKCTSALLEPDEGSAQGFSWVTWMLRMLKRFLSTDAAASAPARGAVVDYVALGFAIAPNDGDGDATKVASWWKITTCCVFWDAGSAAVLGRGALVGGGVALDHPLPASSTEDVSSGGEHPRGSRRDMIPLHYSVAGCPRPFVA